MTARSLPLVQPTARVWQILRRCYPGQKPATDGHLGARGEIKAGAGGRTAGRRP